MAGDTPEKGIQDGAGDGQSEFIVGTYKTIEDTRKGFAEKEALISRLQSERDKAKSEGAKMNELLEKLTEASTRKAEPEPKQENQKEQIEAFVTSAAEALENDPKQGVRMILEAVSGWQGQSEQQQAKAREQAIKSIAEELGQTVAEVKRTLAERDPDMIAYGEQAKKLAEIADADFDKNRDMFLKLAKASAKPNQPPRHQLPGGAISTRVVSDDDGSFEIGEVERSSGFENLKPAVQKRLIAKWRKESNNE